MEFYQDRLGNKIGETYSTMLVDPYFEKKLKSFLPSLKLMFDQVKKKWVILEWAPDNSGWNIIYTFQDDFGNPMPLGDYVFDHLRDMMNQNEIKLKNPDAYFDNLIYKSEKQKEEIQRKSSEEHKKKLLEDINEWRKSSRELKNQPKSDVTAGYRKINQKTKGIIYG